MDNHEELRRERVRKWRALERLKKPLRHNITFPCTETDIHTVSIINGDLFFFNHKLSDIKSLAMLDKLQFNKISQSEACGCVKLMRYFMEHASIYEIGYNVFPVSVQDRISFATVKRETRKEYISLIPPPDSSEEKIKNNFCKMVKKYFTDNVSYRKTFREVWNGAGHKQVEEPLTITVTVGEPNIEGLLVKHKRSNNEAHVNVTLPLTYFSKIFKKGLSVIDGRIILDNLYDFENNSFLALVGKQTYGYRITKEYAIVHPSRNHISYISEEKAREILIKGKTPRSRRTKKELGK